MRNRSDPDILADLLPARGQMGARSRAFNWAATTLGPVGEWPGSLRIAVSTVLTNAYPAALLWGADRVLLYNDPCIRVLGTRHPGAFGRPLADAWPEGNARLAPVLLRVMQGESLALHDELLPRGEVRGGEDAWFTSFFGPVCDVDGEVMGVLVVMTETTERVRAGRELDDALRASEARFRAVANLVPDLLWQSEPDGASLWYNDRWYSYTGQTPEQAAAFGWINALHLHDREAIRNAYLRALREGVPLTREVRIRGADGIPRWFLVRAEPLRDESGTVIQWFGAASDIHEQRRAFEEVELRVQRRNAELASALEDGHALRRQLLSAEEDERRRLARELHDQLGQHLTALTLGLEEARQRVSPGEPIHARLGLLQDLAQAMTRDARYIALELRPPELDDVGLASALETYVEKWSARYGVSADVVISGLERASISPDVGTALYRIAQEALTNVARHAGARHVSVIADRVDNGARLIIEDDGKGFNPETREPEARSQMRLGIAGMRERATLAGGLITIESEIGKGSTLYAHIPLMRPP